MIPLVGGLMMLSSCDKNLSVNDYGLPEDENAQKCVLAVGVTSDPQLKSTGTEETVLNSEKTVGTLQVLVFRDGFLDAYGKAEKSSSLILTCTSGSREVYALVNAPDLSSLSTKSALEAYMIDLNANAPSSLVMYGKQSVTLPVESSVSISVKRMVSRIVVKKVTRNFESSALASLGFSIKAIYVLNASGNANILGNANTKWYNGSSNAADLPSLLYDAVSSGDIKNNAVYSTSHYFYAMPNDNSVKVTTVVIEAVLGDRTFYYPIELPALESNHSYEISGITIKRPGSDSPNVPVSTKDITFSVSVVDWTSKTINEQII